MENAEHYKYPNPCQVGNIVQSTVGHIERFQAQEEIQLEFHLRASGMLDAHDRRQAQIHGKKYKPPSSVKRANILLTAKAPTKEVVRQNSIKRRQQN